MSLFVVSFDKRDGGNPGDFADAEVFFENSAEGGVELKFDVVFFAEGNAREGVLKGVTLDYGGDVVLSTDFFEFVEFPQDRSVFERFCYAVGINYSDDFVGSVGIGLNGFDKLFGNTVGSNDECMVDILFDFFSASEEIAHDGLRTQQKTTAKEKAIEPDHARKKNLSGKKVGDDQKSDGNYSPNKNKSDVVPLAFFRPGRDSVVFGEDEKNDPGKCGQGREAGKK